MFYWIWPFVRQTSSSSESLSYEFWRTCSTWSSSGSRLCTTRCRPSSRSYSESTTQGRWRPRRGIRVRPRRVPEGTRAQWTLVL